MIYLQCPSIAVFKVCRRLKSGEYSLVWALKSVGVEAGGQGAPAGQGFYPEHSPQN